MANKCKLFDAFSNVLGSDNMFNLHSSYVYTWITVMHIKSDRKCSMGQVANQISGFKAGNITYQNQCYFLVLELTKALVYT